MQKYFIGNRYFSEWILLLGGLLLIIGIIGFNFHQDYVDINVRERDRLATHARVLNKSLGNDLEVIDKVLLGIRKDLPDWHSQEGGMSQASYRLRAFTDAMPSLRTILVLDATGNSIAANRPELLGQNFSYRAYFKTASAHPDPNILYMAAPFRTVLGVWTMNVTRVMVGPQGQFSGVIVASLDRLCCTNPPTSR